MQSGTDDHRRTKVEWRLSCFIKRLTVNLRFANRTVLQSASRFIHRKIGKVNIVRHREVNIVSDIDKQEREEQNAINQRSNIPKSLQLI
jgi:hypothetical protein